MSDTPCKTCDGDGSIFVVCPDCGGGQYLTADGEPTYCPTCFDAKHTLETCPDCKGSGSATAKP